MNPIWQNTFKLRSEHVDYAQKMRLSVFLKEIQKACIAHTEELGMGREKTLDRGYLWVVDSLHFKVDRLPVYDEDVTLKCYPGPTLHYFFPRHFVLLSHDGKTLIRGNAMWSLIDSSTRKMVDPNDIGVTISGMETGDEIPPVMGLAIPAAGEHHEIVASYSLCDINGHLTNSAYMDIVTDLMEPSDIHLIKEVALLFKKEVRMGDTLSFDCIKEDNRYDFVSPNFALRLTLSE